jgi:2-iminoacetate synthase
MSTIDCVPPLTLGDSVSPSLFSLADYSGLDERAAAFHPSDIQDYRTARDIPAGARALSLYRNPSISNDELFTAAADAVHAVRGMTKSTFVPIFTTNYCDSECLMCGMRNGNSKLIRKFSGRRKIEEQLRILYEVDGVRAVGFLTGEYRDHYTRMANAFYIGWAINRAFELGFELVYFNIGSLVPEEIEVLAEWLEPGAPATMCVFQETYASAAYTRFMGETDPRVPKSDFRQRLKSFDHWLDHGFRHVNPGFLVGLQDPDEDIAHLATHVDHLASRGANMRISLPRLRPALGTDARSKVSDERYIRVMSTIAYLFPEHPLVLTTREDAQFQRKVMPLVGVISPGSPDVAPYRWSAEATNALESSQFIIPDHRRPRDILNGIVEQGYSVTHFPTASAPPAANAATTAA